MEKKKLIAPMIVAILTLAVLVVGATYAYITVTAKINFNTYTISSSVQSMGSVAINGGSNLTMNLTRTQVQKLAKDTMYYASSNGTATTQATAPTIATASVTGEGTFDCTYTLNISSTINNMGTAAVSKGDGLLVLKINHFNETGDNLVTTYDMNTAHPDLHSTTGVTLNGKMKGLKSGINKIITAQLAYKNSLTADQTALAGTSVTYTFKITKFDCTATA